MNNKFDHALNQAIVETLDEKWYCIPLGGDEYLIKATMEQAKQIIATRFDIPSEKLNASPLITTGNTSIRHVRGSVTTLIELPNSSKWFYANFISGEYFIKANSSDQVRQTIVSRFEEFLKKNNESWEDNGKTPEDINIIPLNANGDQWTFRCYTIID